MRLTILICTHNRLHLLKKTLESLNRAARPADSVIELLVVANACADGTVRFLSDYAAQAGAQGWLPLRWLEEPRQGKSYALNAGIERLATPLVAFVDDDHRVDSAYLTAIRTAARDFPDATLFCGRILPDWDGTEPAWVHDPGPYRIYPLPVPRYDHGMEVRRIGRAGPLPGGGNLFARADIFGRVGGFSTDLGPRGHNLGGGEDIEFVLRAILSGERLQYVPGVTQYHYVDTARFTLSYLMRKSFQRSRASVQVRHGGTGIPRYMWRKLAGYLGGAVFSASWAKTRFNLVRIAAALGELRGMSRQRGRPHARRPDRPNVSAPGVAPVAVALGIATMATLVSFPYRETEMGIGFSIAVGSFFTLVLLTKSLIDFSRTGPALRAEIQRHFSFHSLYALARLGFWSLALSSLMALSGVAVYMSFGVYLGEQPSALGVVASAVLGLAAVTSLQFLRHLLYLPATISASSHYRMSRLYPVWRRLSPGRLRALQAGIVALGTAAAAISVAGLWERQRWGSLAVLIALSVLVAAAVRTMALRRELPPAGAEPGRAPSPNIIMVGSDTLRADRLGDAGYRRNLTPCLDALAKRGVQFSHCYTPCARTAPSLISLLTGTWPHTHGVRDNFVGDDEKRLPVAGLPAILGEAGYRAAVVGDWAAGDMGKFPLGFRQQDLPEDQWNIKYLVRQGPKDLRLFLSLFTHNRFGKRFLPELYYLAGIPLTKEVGSDARAKISELAADSQPFFLNVFMAATHPPFGSEYPYYTLYTDPAYRGESKFVMARLTDPFDIIRRQGDGRKEFDLEQIIDLYDGCVRSFDDEVQRIIDHIEDCGLADNTILVIYSDHGMEFFEHDTWGQGNSVLGDFSAQIPLIIADPRRRGGGVVAKVTRSIDVAPTLLELVGLPVPSSMDGVSLVPLTEGDADPTVPAFNETGIWLTDLPGTPEGHLRYPPLPELLEVPDKHSGTLAIKPQYKDIIVAAKDRMIRTDEWKLVYFAMNHGAVYRLYHVASDPECRHDVLAQHPDVGEQLKASLTAWMQGSREAGRGESRSGARTEKGYRVCAGKPA